MLTRSIVADARAGRNARSGQLLDALDKAPVPGSFRGSRAHDVKFVASLSRPILGVTLSTPDVAPVTWLSHQAHERLSRELEERIANRAGVSKEINDRREEGDLKENGGYHAAKEEQGKQELRITQLLDLLRAAAVDAPVRDGVAGPGMVVQVRFEGDDEVERFLIGSLEENETAGVKVYSAASPLGKALTGAREGDTVIYSTPTGSTMKITLVTAKPFSG